MIKMPSRILLASIALLNPVPFRGGFSYEGANPLRRGVDFYRITYPDFIGSSLLLKAAGNVRRRADCSEETPILPGRSLRYPNTTEEDLSKINANTGFNVLKADLQEMRVDHLLEETEGCQRTLKRRLTRLLFLSTSEDCHDTVAGILLNVSIMVMNDPHYARDHDIECIECNWRGQVARSSEVKKSTAAFNFRADPRGI